MEVQQVRELNTEGDRRQNRPYNQLKCRMQTESHNKSITMAADLQPAPVLSASVLSNIPESSQQVSFILAKEMPPDEEGVARAQLHVLSSFFVVCSIAPDQSADTSQEPVLPAAFPEPSTVQSWPTAMVCFFF